MKNIIHSFANWGLFILISAIFIGLFIFATNRALGASLAAQQQDGVLAGNGEELVQTFTPSQSGFAKYVLERIQQSTAPGTYYGTSTTYLYQDSNPADGYSNLLEIATTTWTAGGGACGGVCQNFNTTTTLSGTTYLNAGTTYTLRAQINSNTSGDPFRFQGVNTNAYGGGTAWFTSLIQDFYFDITDSGGSSAITNYDTRPGLITPGAGQSIPDFTSWIVNINNPTSTVAGSIFVRYSDISTSSWPYSDAISYAPFVSPNPITIPKTRSLYQFQNSTSSVWYAQPVIQGSWGTIFGDVITFTITDPLPGQQAAPQSFRGCFDESSHFFSSSTIKGIACIFFVPSESSTGFINNAYESFQNVFPFSVFFNIRNIVEDSIASSTSAGSLSLTAPGASSTGISFVVVSSSSLINLIGSSAANQLHNFILWFLLLVFTSTIFYTIYKPHYKKR